LNQPYLHVKVVLGIVALAHIITGLVGVIPGVPLSIVLVFYGGALQFSPQIAYLLQMFGAYMLTIGVLCLYAIRNPVQNRNIILGIAFLLLFRGGQRMLLSSSQAYRVFGMVPAYYRIQTALFVGVALALLWFRPQAVERARS
jgi:hypothetical protein